MEQHIVIVGGGLAGVRAAEGARDAGYEGPITIVAAEDVTPYERPPLSKDLLTGDAGLEDALIHDADWFRDNGIGLRVDTRVALIDPEKQLAIVDESDQIPYTELILATGASPNRLDIEGDHLSLIGSLRTVEDARVVRSLLEQQKKVVIVGAGWLGTEVAAAASEHGCDVTVVSRSETPMQRVLGDRFGAYLRELHESRGVEFVTGATPVEYSGDDQVRQVHLDDGRVLDADMVIEAIGARPVIFRGSTKTDEFLVFYLEAGIVRAVVNVNTWGIGDEIEALLRAEPSPDRRAVADWETPLSELF